MPLLSHSTLLTPAKQTLLDKETKMFTFITAEASSTREDTLMISAALPYLSLYGSFAMVVFPFLLNDMAKEGDKLVPNQDSHPRNKRAFTVVLLISVFLLWWAWLLAVIIGHQKSRLKSAA
jgi:hypothetical protein